MEGSLTVGDIEVCTNGAGVTVVGDLVTDLSIQELSRSWSLSRCLIPGLSTSIVPDTGGACKRYSPSAGSNKLLSVLADSSNGVGLITSKDHLECGLGAPRSL